jgi:DNA polymerase-3 subunit epsilon
MDFNLDRDLCFFDLETTGLHVIRDRIIQIAIVKYPKDQSTPKEFVSLVNPGIPISEESMQITGIRPEHLVNKPSFKQMAVEVYDFIGDSDLAGFNSNRFDVPILLEEFHRVGLEFDIENRRLIDAQQIFYKMEPRNLSAALRFYCDKEMENAHDALADVKATIEVLKGQIKMYKNRDYINADGEKIKTPVINNMQTLANFSNNPEILDVTQRLKYDNSGRVIFNFGKYKGTPVTEVFQKDRQYYHWILDKEFSVQVKNIVRKIYRDEIEKQGHNSRH